MFDDENDDGAPKKEEEKNMVNLLSMSNMLEVKKCLHSYLLSEWNMTRGDPFESWYKTNYDNIG